MAGPPGSREDFEDYCPGGHCCPGGQDSDHRSKRRTCRGGSRIGADPKCCRKTPHARSAAGSAVGPSWDRKQEARRQCHHHHLKRGEVGESARRTTSGLVGRTDGVGDRGLDRLNLGDCAGLSRRREIGRGVRGTVDRRSERARLKIFEAVEPPSARGVWRVASSWVVFSSLRRNLGCEPASVRQTCSMETERGQPGIERTDAVYSPDRFPVRPPSERL